MTLKYSVFPEHTAEKLYAYAVPMPKPKAKRRVKTPF